MFTGRKLAVVSVINDLVSDNRVLRSCSVLQEAGYDLLLIGRKKPGSLPIRGWKIKTNRMRMFFHSGPLFYLFFNLRLFFKLWFSKAGLLFANDLDTLLPNYLVARLKHIPLIYDSHELFCEVPELQNSPFKKRIWQKLEGSLIPRLRNCVTVNESIAEIFENRYGTKFTVIRNIADVPQDAPVKSRQELGLPFSSKIILLQGAGINIDRGAEELVEAMCYVKDAMLLIIGSGDVWPRLEKMVASLNLKNKVFLINRMPAPELRHYTFNADLGVSIDKNTNLNYRYSLPNKIFDYLNAGLPVLASRLPEVEKVLNHCQAGVFIDDHHPQHIAGTINRFFDTKSDHNTERIRESASVFSWQTEKQKLLGLITEVSTERLG